ncbi:AsnC family transcriptional regulator [Thalassotalea loyana]|uniref:AsnC family transcriptional regulator n=1 Tax=Thalassotalea loyana TaxID=280483 RepID=A0ABQ6HG13_9GAMM|nr:Lrp/AsnC family transcriptional regulator [Thalassotalea loyana]GLX85667.1 AsnC family transcriptional regulator [Thalassotalea loyana]
MTELDNIDRQIIGILRTDARTSVSNIAQQIKVSRATIQNRIDKLEKSGVITGYTALISTAGNQNLASVRALMNIELVSANTDKVKNLLLTEPSVCAIHTTNGRWDMVVELQATSLESLDKILGRIRAIPDITSSETNILLSSTRTKSSDLAS